MLNNIGLPGLLLIAVVVLVLFGRGKISSMMGEVGKGITAFRRGMDDGRKEIEDATVARDASVAPPQAHTTTTTTVAADGSTVTHIAPDSAVPMTSSTPDRDRA
jgi:sec-independent protein translocase protein TatA